MGKIILNDFNSKKVTQKFEHVNLNKIFAQFGLRDFSRKQEEVFARMTLFGVMRFDDCHFTDGQSASLTFIVRLICDIRSVFTTRLSRQGFHDLQNNAILDTPANKKDEFATMRVGVCAHTLPHASCFRTV